MTPQDRMRQKIEYAVMSTAPGRQGSAKQNSPRTRRTIRPAACGMIGFELVWWTENHPDYQRLEAANHLRHGEFLESLIFTALKLDQRHLSQTVIKALNHHAIACLHPYDGGYRPCEVSVGQGPAQYNSAGPLQSSRPNGRFREYGQSGIARHDRKWPGSLMKFDG